MPAGGDSWGRWYTPSEARERLPIPRCEARSYRFLDGRLMAAAGAEARPAGADAIEVEVDHGGGEEREHLTDDEAADDGDAKRAAEFGTGAVAQRERQRAQHRGHRGH